MTRNALTVSVLAIILLIVVTCFSVLVLRPIQQDLAAIKSMLAVAVDPPEQAAKQLQQFEDGLSDESNWPSSRETAKSLRDEYQQFTERAPSVVSADWRNRLAAIRWGIESLSYAVELHNVTTVEQLDAIQGECQSQVDNIPSSSLSFVGAIKSRLQSGLTAATEKNRQQLKQQATAAAKAALDGHGNLESAMHSLEPFQDDGVKELRGRLQLSFMENRVDENLKQFRNQLDIAKQADKTNLQQAGIGRVMQESIELYYTLAEQQPRPDKAITSVKSLLDDCDKQMKQSTEHLQQDVARKSRVYQKWALDQILAFDSPTGWQYNETIAWMDGQLKSFAEPAGPVDWPLLRDFPSAREVLQDKLELEFADVKGSVLSPEKQKQIYDTAYRKIGWKNSVDKEIACRTTRDGMVKFLLPINVAMLEPPVAHFYSKAYERAQKSLENHGDDLLFVAKQAAEVKKKTLDDF
jgi:hypothetical protein